MKPVDFDWNAIRPLNGGQDKGFEELCAQLARAESPADSRFIRKGTPDAGVECYAILGDKSEWGWQAKYFGGLKESQWSQINDSIAKALEKHPRLVRYYVCIPLDLPDGRIEGSKSARERWNEHVQTWKTWASDRGMVVEFILWGSHEILELLVQPQHVGRLRFWFNVRGFDGAWFSARLDEALQTAGPRYTPEIHVELPIADEFEAFGRTEHFFDNVKKLARKIRDKFQIYVHCDVPAANDPNIDAATNSLAEKVGAVLEGLAGIEFKPVGALPFLAIAEQMVVAESAADELVRLLSEQESDFDTKASAEAENSSETSYHRNPFRDRRLSIYALSAELLVAHEALSHADRVASGALMLLRGDAGTGKTHLLCDVARHRIEANQPTILLLGQRFVSHDAPWPQVFQQLDITGFSAEEFVGTLESAAQAAGSRALILIDAINEGSGRSIWPSHLPAFLAHIERSQWIGVVLSVRSSYQDIVVPEAVRTRAVLVTHQGFADHEYDATRTFFVYYGLELPSTPLLAPEFRNPFFLKTLCSGLHAKGERRLPRGFQGITAVFELYLSAINDHLASLLGFNPRMTLVQQALEAVSKALVDADEKWLTLERATEIVNALFPGREYEGSLYRGLVAEGVLVEEAGRVQDAAHQEIVFVAYDRFADHLMTKTLLDNHFDSANPAAAFTPGGGLAFLVDKTHYVAPGVLEAMCIQVAERCGQELVIFAPMLAERWKIGDAFRQSLVWRAVTAFSDGTREAMDKLSRSDRDQHETLDVLLTVATLPGHPLNADFLDRRLRKDTMPERDAWWSIYLHEVWDSHGAVDRLVDWASSVTPSMTIDDDTLNLSSTSLAWMLTTSNRFLRDRATKALVSLLTGRISAVGRLIDRFTDVDDPYVVQRVYAVAYGVAMRCYDPGEIGALAEHVYSHIFNTNAPPLDILLRDYARGVVERALYLGSRIEVEVRRIRPPYRSEWPAIPTEEDIKPFLPDWSHGSHDSGELEWARNSIGFSIFDDDFGDYVIGTNASNHWLSLKLEEPAWKIPERPEDQLRALVAEFSDEERGSWETFEAADNALREASRPLITEWFDRFEKENKRTAEISDIDALEAELEENPIPELAELKVRAEHATQELGSVLSPAHTEQLAQIIDAKKAGDDTRHPPGFDLRQIQRYILRRVFDLGWTTERFGRFDRFSISSHGRSAHKAERIGKKYQWIAYYEIMALVADHFQYRDQFSEEEWDKAYNGPWQNHLRDIDPSCTVRSLRGGASWEGHSPAWWGSIRYDNWSTPPDPSEWVVHCDDLPNVTDLLIVTNPDDKSRWLNAQGFFNWRQRPPADKESTDVERRALWLLCTGYLIRAEDAQSFVKWAEGVSFWGRWMPDPPQVYDVFLGEHSWAPASRYFQQQYYSDEGWSQPNHRCPIKVRNVAFEYMRESSGFDCSVDESYTLRLPVAELVSGMRLRWFGNGADFLDDNGRLTAFDPTPHADGPSAFLLREELLRKFLDREGLTLGWAILGEKRVLSPGLGSGPYYPTLCISGAYVLGQEKPVGLVKFILETPNVEDRSLSSRVISINRSST